ncbi:MAG: hypothetical protein WCI74_07540 [Actinomycetes bacterium]
MRPSTWKTSAAAIALCALTAGCSGQSSGGASNSPSPSWTGPVQGMSVTVANTATQGMSMSLSPLGTPSPNATPLAAGSTSRVVSPECSGPCTTGVNATATLQSTTSPITVEVRNQGGTVPTALWCYKGSCTSESTYSPGDTRSFPVQEPRGGTEIATMTIRRANDADGVQIWTISIG